jgi:hypothetical protein
LPIIIAFLTAIAGQRVYMNLEKKELTNGIAAGVAVSIMSIGISSPIFISMILFLISPLPIMLAGLAFGPVSVLISVLTSMFFIASFTSIAHALTLSISIVIPSAAASYFFCMPRTQNFQTKWYALSHILLYLGILVAFSVAVYPFVNDYDVQFVKEKMATIVDMYAQSNPQITANNETKTQAIDFFIGSLPFFQTISWLLILIGNFYGAIFIATRLNFLVRPSENWSHALHMPRYIVGLFGITFLGSFFFAGFLPFAGAFALLLTMSGFAFVHVLTQGKTWQPFALLATYFAAFFIGIASIFLFIGIYRSMKTTSTLLTHKKEI